MSINKRIKEVRLAKELSMNAFGKAIGLSQSGVSAIEYETRPVTEKNIKLICITFNVNEAWLRTGEGDMFIRNDQTMLSDIAKKYSLDSLDTAILESYISLPPSARAAVKAYIRALAVDIAQREAADPHATVKDSIKRDTDADIKSRGEAQ